MLSSKPVWKHMLPPLKHTLQRILRVAGKMVSVEIALSNQLLENRVHSLTRKNESRQHTLPPFVRATSLGITDTLKSSLNSKLPKTASLRNNEVKTYATRRRRMAYSRTETYVLLEPGQDEKFVSEEELKAKLKGLLENWPGKALPRDLARFSTIDEAVSFLVSSVCELELDGDVGSIQWYEVQLE